MRLVILFMLISPSLYANTFWEDVSEGSIKKYNEQKIELEGTLDFVKKYIRARDNFYKLKIKDPNSKKYVEVKFYTIRRLSRVNYFNCKEGQNIEIKGHFRVNVKKHRIGQIKIDTKTYKLICKDM